MGVFETEFSDGGVRGGDEHRSGGLTFRRPEIVSTFGQSWQHNGSERATRTRRVFSAELDLSNW